MAPEDVKRGIDVASGFIAFRMRSEFEVFRRLKREGLDEADIATVIDRLKRMDLVDDQAFAGAYARDQILGRKRGPVRVRRGLISLGVDRELAESAVAGVTADHDIYSQALDLGRKRWNTLGRIADVRRRRKRVYDYLARRGYELDEIRAVLDQLERSDE